MEKLIKIELKKKPKLYRSTKKRLDKWFGLPRKRRIKAEVAYKKHAQRKVNTGDALNILFVCHEPALWSMFDSIYGSMREDPRFNATVVSLPYKHASLAEGYFKDAGMAAFCARRGIEAIPGYDQAGEEWLDPRALAPDYIFFQTPYPLFSQQWSVEYVSSFCRVCYIPYATCLFSGEVDEVLHPEPFYKEVYVEFMESAFSRALFLDHFREKYWMVEERVVNSGHPKLDYLIAPNCADSNAWKRGPNGANKRILWTPRWNTEEGCCHFFEYKGVLSEFCSTHLDVDFSLRPHPLCFQNFLNTGELSEHQLEQLENEYQQSPNKVIDRAAEYQGTFLSCDILISDISSMMLEFFATGKPIIYTHRVDLFNELGREFSKGLYWVNNENELVETLEMLLRGEDPLKPKREALVSQVLNLPEQGAGVSIREFLFSDFSKAGTTGV